ncbi:hypothetical protein [Fodinicola feengrottensis]|uniref:hypothetical protein n=1 Tax=Fodinicola feengrottensis TaxID=435914 RepID=UPI0031D8755B
MNDSGWKRPDGEESTGEEPVAVVPEKADAAAPPDQVSPAASPPADTPAPDVPLAPNPPDIPLPVSGPAVVPAPMPSFAKSGSRPPYVLLALTLTAWVVVLVLAIGAFPAISFYRATHDGTVPLVTSFLDALRRKDVAGALRIARPTTQPDLKREQFLDKGFLRTDWKVTSAVEAGDPFPQNQTVERLVRIKITAADGTSSTGSIYLVADPHPPVGQPGWRIPVPYAQVTLDSPQAFEYLTLNGKRATSVPGPTLFQVFPGSYVPQSLEPSMVTSADPPLIVATAGYSGAGVATLPMEATLTPAASHLYEQQIRTQLNICVRSSALAPQPNCPFRLNDPTTFRDGTLIGHFSALRWKINSFPALGDPVHAPDGSFIVDTTTPGEAQVDGQGVGVNNGDQYGITVPCEITARYLVMPAPPNALTVTLEQENPAPAC